LLFDASRLRLPAGIMFPVDAQDPKPSASVSA
jgi:hypothetical protein